MGRNGLGGRSGRWRRPGAKRGATQSRLENRRGPYALGRGPAGDDDRLDGRTGPGQYRRGVGIGLFVGDATKRANDVADLPAMKRLEAGGGPGSGSGSRSGAAEQDGEQQREQHRRRVPAQLLLLMLHNVPPSIDLGSRRGRGKLGRLYLPALRILKPSTS